MKIIIILCFLVCHFIKPIWKAFLVGVFSYIIISFLILIISTSPDSKLNLTGSSFSYFAAGAIGEFLLYFVIGLVIFLIFNKPKKTEESINESKKINGLEERRIT
jgi:uncharacterized membrane protein